MCQKEAWEEAIASQTAYYPPTFQQDGHFTHATSVPQRLLDTANHFYTSSKGGDDWICLQLSRNALANVGIVTKDEGGLPVGDTKVDENVIQKEWKCPHIYGGIPTLSVLGVLVKTFDMARNKEDGTFVKIVGLTDWYEIDWLIDWLIGVVSYYRI